MFIEWIITVSIHDVTTLQQEVRELTELVHKLVAEFWAVKHELEASRLDVDSIRVALCEMLASKHASTSVH